jgi:hypothetical protein
MRLHGILENFMRPIRLQEISRGFARLHGTSEDFMGLHRDVTMMSIHQLETIIRGVRVLFPRGSVPKEWETT